MDEFDNMNLIIYNNRTWVTRIFTDILQHNLKNSWEKLWLTAIWDFE